MSHYDYEKSKEISKEDPPFASLIMSAGRKADTGNFNKLKLMFPEIINELEKKYYAPGGILPGEEEEEKNKQEIY
jgi:hypothetical protein